MDDFLIEMDRRRALADALINGGRYEGLGQQARLFLIYKATEGNKAAVASFAGHPGNLRAACATMAEPGYQLPKRIARYLVISGWNPFQGTPPRPETTPAVGPRTKLSPTPPGKNRATGRSRSPQGQAPSIIPSFRLSKQAAEFGCL